MRYFVQIMRLVVNKGLYDGMYGIKYNSGAKTCGWSLEVSCKLVVMEVNCLQGICEFTIELLDGGIKYEKKKCCFELFRSCGVFE